MGLKQFFLRLLSVSVFLCGFAPNALALPECADSSTLGTTCNMYGGQVAVGNPNVGTCSNPFNNRGILNCHNGDDVNCTGICLTAFDLNNTVNPPTGLTCTFPSPGTCNCGTFPYDLATCDAPGTVSISPNTYNFGNVAVGSSSAPRTVTITNNTATSYTSCSLSADSNASGAFNIAGAGNCSSLAAGASCSFTVTGAPPAASSYSTTFTLSCGPSVCANDKKSKFDFVVDAGKKIGKDALAFSIKSISAIDDLLIGTAGSCTVPMCPPTTYCDCIGSNFMSCTPAYVDQNACFCGVGYNTAVTCGGPPPGGPALCATSGAFTVTGTAAATCSSLNGTTESFTGSAPSFYGSCPTSPAALMCMPGYPSSYPYGQTHDELCIYEVRSTGTFPMNATPQGPVMIVPTANSGCRCDAMPTSCGFRCQTSPNEVCGVDSGTWQFSNCQPFSTPSCTYTVGSGTDCTALTCPTQTRYFLQASGDVAAYGTADPGSYSLGFCRQNTNDPTIAQTLQVVCGSINPLTVSSMITCSDNPSLTYYTNTNSYPLGCGITGAGCTGSSSPSPSPSSPSPSPSPGCNFDIGGAGRICTVGGPTTCCGGYTCEIAGAQPLMRSHWCNGGSGCTDLVNFRTNFSEATDQILANSFPASAPGISITNGPIGVCVDAASKTAAGANTTSNFYWTPSNSGTVDTTALRYDNTAGINKFRCELQDAVGGAPNTPDNHRNAAGCSCAAGYEAAVLLPAQTVAYERSTKLEWLWARVLEAIEQKKATMKAVAKVYDKAVPSANAVFLQCDAVSVGAICNVYGNNYQSSFPGTCQNGINNQGILNCKSDQNDCQGYCLTEFDYNNNFSPPAAACPGGMCNCGAMPFSGATCVAGGSCNPNTTIAGGGGAPNGINCDYDCVGAGPLPDVFMNISSGTCADPSNVSNAATMGGCTMGAAAIACTVNPAASPAASPSPSTGCPAGFFNWDTEQTCTTADMGCRCPGPGTTSGCWAAFCDSGTRCCDCPAVGSPGWSQLTPSGQATCTVSSSPSPSPASSSPSPSPGAAASPTPVLSDNGANGTTFWKPWQATNQDWGHRSSPISALIAEEPMVKAGTARVACVPECPKPGGAANSHRVCWSAATGCDPTDMLTACACDTAGYTFNPSAVPPACEQCSNEGMFMDPVLGCVCPVGYTLIPNNPADPTAKCRPNLPSTAGAPVPVPGLDVEFIRGTGTGGTDPDKDYPVCGPSRLPVKNDHTILNIASSSIPATQSVTTGTGMPNGSYKYTTPIGPQPFPSPYYYYWDYPRCSCATTTVAGTPLLPPPVTVMPSTVTSGAARFVDDTLFSIGPSGWDGKPVVPYGPVAIASDNGAAANPRLGSVFSATSGVTSSCHCPNVNEKADPIDASDPLSGSVCKPDLALFNNDPTSIQLIKFQPAIHDGAQSIVLNRASEAKDTSTNAVIDKILLPLKSDAYQFDLTASSYARGIWTCQSPLSMDAANKKCDFIPAHNACDATSEMSGKLTGADYATRFTNTVNKKLNCCGFQFGSAGSLGAATVKFDCIANENLNYPDFNTLWASRDLDADGGQLNAIVLYGKSGRELTGWYTLDGQRCTQYPSLSSAPIIPGTVSAAVTMSQQQTIAGNFVADNNVRFSQWVGNAWVGTTSNQLQAPTGAEWSDLTTRLMKTGMRTPPSPSTDAADLPLARACPIYVRAAVIYGCQENAIGSSQKRLFTDGLLMGRPKMRCAAAARTQVHVRVEQIFKVAGTKPQSTIDTILDNTQTHNISLQELWQVNGFGTCPSGGKRIGDACTW